MNSSFMRVAYFCIAVVVSIVSSNAQAAGWLNKSTVSRLVVHDWGDAVFVYYSPVNNNPDACSASWAVVLRRDHPLFKEMYAALLTASQTQTAIGGFVNGCDAGHYNLPMLTRVDLLPNPNQVYP